MTKNPKKCLYCDRELESWRREDIKFCSSRCRFLSFHEKDGQKNRLYPFVDVSKRISQLPSWMRPAENKEDE